MHQLIPPVPVPSGNSGAFAYILILEVGHLICNFYLCLRAGHLPIPGTSRALEILAVLVSHMAENFVSQVKRRFCSRIVKLNEELVFSHFIPAFSVTCMADIFCHPSFDMLSKQDGSKSTNHSPLTCHFELLAHLHRSEMKQTSACIGCDWLILNSTLKDDVER